jgi:hypothetical protein
MNKDYDTPIFFNLTDFYNMTFDEILNKAANHLKIDLEKVGIKVKKVSLDFEFENEEQKFTKEFSAGD